MNKVLILLSISLVIFMIAPISTYAYIPIPLVNETVTINNMTYTYNQTELNAYNKWINDTNKSFKDLEPLKKIIEDPEQSKLACLISDDKPDKLACFKLPY